MTQPFADRPSLTSAPALLGDGRTLADLLAMAGPDIAPALLRQIAADLSDVRTALAPAITAQDWTAIRAQSHVLISLAGTIGATRLHAMARDLNTAAHDRCTASLARLSPPVTADLDTLTAHLCNLADP